MRIYVLLVGDGLVLNDEKDRATKGMFQSDMSCYFVKRGMSRLCYTKYSPVTKENVDKPSMHIANDAIQFKEGAIMDEILRPLDHIISWRSGDAPGLTRWTDLGKGNAELDKVSEEDKASEGDTYASIVDIISKLVSAYQHTLRKQFLVNMKAKENDTSSSGHAASEGGKRKREEEGLAPTAETTLYDLKPHQHERCYQLIGLDLMIDTKGRSWLMEANAKPCMEWSEASDKESGGIVLDFEEAVQAGAIATGLRLGRLGGNMDDSTALEKEATKVKDLAIKVPINHFKYQ